MVKTILRILFLFFFTTVTFLIIASPTLAAVIVTIPNTLDPITTDQPFSFNVSVSGASAGTNYLRVDLYKGTTGTPNYFGETYNNTSWYNGSTGTQYFPITIVSGQTWIGSVQGKIGTPTSTEYSGSGNYNLKVRRYTSASSYTWSNEASLTINYSITSPSPSPSSTNSTVSSFSISNIPLSIDSTQTFTTSINLELSSYPSTKFYLKGAFAKSSSTNYFGFTKVSNSWIKNGSTYSDQYSITTDSSGKWSGSLEIQPDVFDSGYEGTNDYIFKVARYTSNGNGPIWSNESNIKINAKEVEMAEENIILTGLSAPKSSAVLGESKSQIDLPEVVYSLENYKKSSTRSGQKTSSPSAKAKASTQKIPVLFYFLGGSFLFVSGGIATYLYLKNRLKSLS